MTGVVTADGEYAAAIAELPLAARRVTDVAGSVVVIDGRVGWGERLRRAADDGAAAVVLVEPASVEHGEFRAAGEPGIPVIVDRARLRPDVVADATDAASPPRSVQVECAAGEAELAVVLRDAVGWARLLAGGVLALRQSRLTPRAALLQFERTDAAGVPATVLLGRRDSAASWMRALALDATRTEVSIQHRVGSPIVVRASREGQTQSPLRYESTARLALRRAIAALDGGHLPSDLAELHHDSSHAASV